MRRATFLFLSLSAASLTAADYRDVQKTVALNPTGEVRIENHKGAIHVSTWDRAEVEIHARIQPEPGRWGDWRPSSSPDVSIDASSNWVRIQTRYSMSDWCCTFGSSPEVRYTIRMPRTARLTVRDHRSEVEISDLQGALDLETHRGSARVVRLGGPLRLDTHRGDVTVEFASFSASSINTHRGKIDLALPRGTGFDLDADLDRRASLDSASPVTTRLSRRRGERFRGEVNGGGPVLRLVSHRGDIRLR